MFKTRYTLKKFNSPLNSKGQGLIEYLMLVSLIAVVTIGVVKVVGQNVKTQYEIINRALGADTQGDLKIRNANSNAMKQKDLSNFLDGARNDSNP